MGRHRLRLIGSFGLRTPQGDRLPVTSRKGIALIAMIALSRDGERSRAWLQDRLWGSRSPDQARASLRRELSNLRAAINRQDAPPLIGADMMRVRLDLDAIDVDVRTLSAAIADRTGVGPIQGGELLEGLDVRGEEGFEDWLREQRRYVDDLIEQARGLAWVKSAIDGPTDTSAAAAPKTQEPAPPGHDPPLPTRPSIGVLRLHVATSDPNTIATAQGISDEVSTSLSRFSTLFVVAAGAPPPEGLPDPAGFCRQLGVRYLLAGSLQRSGDFLRIQMHLIDAALGEQVWAERFEGRLAEIFDVQDRIAATVAPIVDATIEQAERRHALRRPVESAAAYDLYWRANALFREWEPEPMKEATRLAEKILELEPGNAWAASLAAFCRAVAYTFRWVDDPERTRTIAFEHYERAMRHGGDDPFVLGYAAGTLLGVGGDLDQADRLIERALAIHPTASASLFWGGWVDVARGDATRALARFALAQRLNPRSAVRPHNMTGMGICLLSLGRPQEAMAMLEDARQQLPHQALTVAGLAIAALMLGRADEAAVNVARLDRLGGVEAVSGILRSPAQRERLAAGVALARQTGSP